MDGTSHNKPIPAELTTLMATAKSKGSKGKCMSSETLAATISQTSPHDLLPCVVRCNTCCDNLDLTSHIRTLLTTPTTTPASHNCCIEALPDKGALQRNYVGREFADWLTASIRNKGDSSSSCTCTYRECTVIPPAANAPRVCSGFANDRSNSMCATSLGTIKFSLHFLNELTNNVETITGLVAVILNSDFDLILGRPFIREIDLTTICPSLFRSKNAPYRPQCSQFLPIKLIPHQSHNHSTHTGRRLCTFRQ